MSWIKIEDVSFIFTITYDMDGASFTDGGDVGEGTLKIFYSTTMT